MTYEPVNEPTDEQIAAAREYLRTPPLPHGHDWRNLADCERCVAILATLLARRESALRRERDEALRLLGARGGMVAMLRASCAMAERVIGNKMRDIDADCLDDLREALADTEATALAHEERVRAEAFEEAAKIAHQAWSPEEEWQDMGWHAVAGIVASQIVDAIRERARDGR